MSPKYQRLVLIAIFSIFNVLWYLKYGIKEVCDSERYFEYAEAICHGQFYQEHNIWYIGYGLFLAFFKHFHLPTIYIVIAQVLISFFSVWAIYKSILELTEKYVIAFFGTLYYLFFIEITGWNFYILTESIYTSALCFFIFFTVRWQKGSIYNLFGVIIMLIIIFWLRPMGVCLLGAVVCYTWIILNDRMTKVWWIGLGFLLLVLSFCLVSNMLQTFYLVENYAIGEVVFGISRIPKYPGHEYILLEVPQNLYIRKEGSVLGRAGWFFIENPVYAFKLMGLKIFFFITHLKPYNSLIHNIYNVILLVLGYVGLFLFLMKNKMLFRYFIAFYFFCFILMIGFTSEDWDGRFIVGLVPFLAVWGSLGWTAFKMVRKTDIKQEI